MQMNISDHAPVSKSSLGDEWEQLRQDTIHFGATVVRPDQQEIRDTETIPPALLEALKETGRLGMLIPKRYGGNFGDCLARVINVSHLARECPDLGAVLQIAQGRHIIDNARFAERVARKATLMDVEAAE